jgi:hypothetical protein
MKDDRYPTMAGELKIKINDNILPGHYANQIVIMHSQDEFILDYVAAFPPEPSVVSRVVMTPGHFKRILTAMTDNLKKYESQFGEIKTAVEPITPVGSQPLH